MAFNYSKSRAYKNQTRFYACELDKKEGAIMKPENLKYTFPLGVSDFFLKEKRVTSDLQSRNML